MPTCDEDGCTTEATCTCGQCAAQWCDDDSGGTGAACPQCGSKLEAL